MTDDDAAPLTSDQYVHLLLYGFVELEDGSIVKTKELEHPFYGAGLLKHLKPEN